MFSIRTPLAAAILATTLSQLVYAEESSSDQSVELDAVSITAARDDRVSKGAIGLPLSLKETPQSITILDDEAMDLYDASGTNDALKMMNGIDVQEYETNRTSYNARGFEIQLTQVDGLGTGNDYGTVLGQQDTFLFERIELVRGANGLLTGVGNSSGTINYVRKRPTNEDEAEILFTVGSYNQVRLGVDGNKVLTSDGRWAGLTLAIQKSRLSYLK